MITMELPEKITWHETVLEPDESRITKGVDVAGAGQLKGWVSLGEPVIFPITLDEVPEDDPDLRQFLAANGATYNFYMVHLACTFRPADGESFDKAWLAVDLSREDGLPQPQPIAWSMKPTKLDKLVEISRTVKLGATLKLAEIVVGPEAGLEQERKWTGSEIFLEALNELQPNPIWEFSRTNSVEIRGGHRLVLVARTPKEAATQGAVSLSASVERKRLGIIPYRAAFPQAPDLAFRLP
jgi:hypothetical protein